MADVTMCMNNLCEMKDDCLRYTAKPNEFGYQSKMYYICEGNEYYFISNKEKIRKLRNE